MQKFTAFTVILTILIIVVVSDIVANDYANKGVEVPVEGDVLSANVLGADVLGTEASLDLSSGNEALVDSDEESIPATDPIFEEDVMADILNEDAEPEAAEPTVEDSLSELLAIDHEADTGIQDFEDASAPGVAATQYSPNVYIRDEQLISAGFVNAYLEEGSFDGSLFKSVNLLDIPELDVKQNVIRTEHEMLAKVYVFRPNINFEVGDLYELLKLRSAEGLNMEVNETNEFGQASFYMNDTSRPNVAFLSVRIGGLIYSFSYPKTYHSQVKNLIQLIEWEFSA